MSPQWAPLEEYLLAGLSVRGNLWLLWGSQHAKKSAFKMAVFWLLEEDFVAG